MKKLIKFPVILLMSILLSAIYARADEGQKEWRPQQESNLQPPA